MQGLYSHELINSPQGQKSVSAARDTPRVSRDRPLAPRHWGVGAPGWHSGRVSQRSSTTARTQRPIRVPIVKMWQTLLAESERLRIPIRPTFTGPSHNSDYFLVSISKNSCLQGGTGFHFPPLSLSMNSLTSAFPVSKPLFPLPSESTRLAQRRCSAKRCIVAQAQSWHSKAVEPHDPETTSPQFSRPNENHRSFPIRSPQGSIPFHAIKLHIKHSCRCGRRIPSLLAYVLGK